MANKQYKTCPFCKANLDYGEHCDCRDKKKEIKEKYEDILFADDSGQITMKEAAYDFGI